MMFEGSLKRDLTLRMLKTVGLAEVRAFQLFSYDFVHCAGQHVKSWLLIRSRRLAQILKM